MTIDECSHRDERVGEEDEPLDFGGMASPTSSNGKKRRESDEDSQLGGEDDRAEGGSDDGKEVKKRRKVWRVMLTPEQAKEIYLRRPALDELHGKCVYTHGAMRNARIVAKEYDVSAKTIRDIWNRYSWAKVTRDLWTPQEAIHYSTTYPVRGHQGMAVISEMKNVAATASFLGRNSLVSSSHKAVNKSSAQTPIAPMSTCWEPSLPMQAHVQQQSMHPSEALTMLSMGLHNAAPAQQQQQPSMLSQHSYAAPATGGVASRDGGMMGGGNYAGYGSGFSSNANGMGSNGSFARMVAPSALMSRMGSSSDNFARVSSTHSDDGLFVGDDRMNRFNAEIDQIFQNPLGSAAVASPYSWPKGDSSCKGSDSMFNVNFSQQPSNSKVVDSLNAVHQMLGMQKQGFLSGSANNQQQQQVFAQKPHQGMEPAPLQAQIDQAHRRLNQLLFLQQQAVAGQAMVQRGSFDQL